ncbi:ATP-binding cassette domain-containing protein [Tabrizicola sp.]|uniref:ATP-binding cassette domain-containing protein n=1 Tax=Tabrizicola sp. TaxID=2005166 RepID=UPI003F3806AC
MNAPTPPTRFAVEISHLNHWFGDGDLRRLVLRDLSLNVERGKTTFLMGPSGCGKTTLLTLVGALRSVLEGSVKVLGRELLGADEAVMVETRRRAGFVFQHHNLHRSLTVLQNVRMGLEVKGEAGAGDAKERCMEVISAVGLADHAHKYQDQISGGQKQRAAVARALVGKPELLLADEPTAALDSKTGRDVIELMQRLAVERGMTVLMVTHDNRILDIADRIVEMEDGRILPESGSQAEVVVHPARKQALQSGS